MAAIHFNTDSFTEAAMSYLCSGGVPTDDELDDANRFARHLRAVYPAPREVDSFEVEWQACLAAGEA